MPTDQNHITASCIIEKGTVVKNRETIFTQGTASVADFLLSLYKSLGTEYPRFYKMDNLSKLGWLASEIVLKDGFAKEKYTAEETGIVLSNANASFDTDLKYFQTVKDIASPSVFVYTLPNIMIGEICIRNRFKGESAFFVSETFDAALIEIYVNNLLNSGTLSACICGWVELTGDEYKAALFLVEKTGGEIFSAEAMNQLFN